MTPEQAVTLTWACVQVLAVGWGIRLLIQVIRS